MATETFVIESTLETNVAFSRLIDLSRVPEWDRGIAESRLIESAIGTLGARYDLTLTGFDGKPTNAIYELTAVDVDRSFTMVGTNPTFRAEDTVTVESLAQGCRVTYLAGLALAGEHRPMTEAQLSAVFAKVVAIAQRGLTQYLNP